MSADQPPTHRLLFHMWMDSENSVRVGDSINIIKLLEMDLRCPPTYPSRSLAVATLPLSQPSCILCHMMMMGYHCHLGRVIIAEHQGVAAVHLCWFARSSSHQAPMHTGRQRPTDLKSVCSA